MSADRGPVRGRERLSARVATLLGLLLTSHAALAWYVRQREFFTGGDDTFYVLLARSLRELSYRELQYIGEPIAARYPPLYPALLAGLTSIFGERLDVIAAVGILASVAGLLALFDVIRRRWSPELGLVVVAIAAINPAVVSFAGAVGTEAPYMALAMIALWAADRYDAAGGRRAGLLAGASSIAAALTRSVGVTLVGALGLHWLLRRRWRSVALLALPFVLTVGLWLAWTVVAPGREMRRSYIDDAVNLRIADGTLAGTLAARFRRNVTVYGGQITTTQLQLPVTSRTKLDNVAWTVVLATLGLIGLAACWRRWNAAALYLPVYGGLLLVWPYTEERFLMPIIPLIVAVVLIGVWEVGHRLLRQRAAGLVAGAAAVLAVFALIRDGALAERAAACARARVDCASAVSLDFVDAARYAAEATPAGARFVAPKNATLFYYAHRPTAYWDEAVSQSPASFRPYLRDRKIGYVLATPVFARYRELYRLLHANCEYFDIVRAYSPSTMILALRDTPHAAGPAAPACTAMARVLERRIGY